MPLTTRNTSRPAFRSPARSASWPPAGGVRVYWKYFAVPLPPAAQQPPAGSAFVWPCLPDGGPNSQHHCLPTPLAPHVLAELWSPCALLSLLVLV